VAVEITYFDLADEHTWLWYRDHFDADGQRLTQEVMRDNGASELTTYDVQELYPWTSNTSYYDQVGNLVGVAFAPLGLL
jgi:hypothetical protein